MRSANVRNSRSFCLLRSLTRLFQRRGTNAKKEKGSLVWRVSLPPPSVLCAFSRSESLLGDESANDLGPRKNEFSELRYRDSCDFVEQDFTETLKLKIASLSFVIKRDENLKSSFSSILDIMACTVTLLEHLEHVTY